MQTVLLAARSCITAQATFILQTEEGAPPGPLSITTGYSVGKITITTTGTGTFTVDADGMVTVGTDERAAAGLPRTFPLDN